MEMAAARLDQDREEKMSKIRLKIQNRGGGGGGGGGVLIVGCFALIAAGIGAAFAARGARDRHGSVGRSPGGTRGLAPPVDREEDPESSRGEIKVDCLVGDQWKNCNDHCDGIVQELSLGGVEEEEEEEEEDDDGTTQHEIEQKFEGSEIVHVQDFYHQEEIPFNIELQEEEETESSTEGDERSERTNDASTESNEEEQAWRAELPLDRVEDSMASEAVESSTVSWSNYENKIVDSEVVIDTRENEVKANMDNASTRFEEGTCLCIKLNTENEERHCQNTEMGSETLGTQSISKNTKMVMEFGANIDNGDDVVKELSTSVVASHKQSMEKSEITSIKENQELLEEFEEEESELLSEVGRSMVEETYPEQEKELSSIDSEKIEVETPLRTDDIVGNGIAQAEEPKVEDLEVTQDSSLESSAQEICIARAEGQVVKDLEVIKEDSPLESNAEEIFPEEEKEKSSIDLEKIEQVEIPTRNIDMVGISHAEEEQKLEDSEVIQASSFESSAEETFPEKEKELPSIDLCKIEQVETQKTIDDIVDIKQAEEEQKIEDSEVVQGSSRESSAEKSFPEKEEVLPSIDLEKNEVGTPKRTDDMIGIEKAEEEHELEDSEVIQDSSWQSNAEEIFPEEEIELPSIDLQKIEQVETPKRIGDTAGIEEAEEEHIVEDPEVIQGSSLKSSKWEIFPEEEKKFPSIDLQAVVQVETPKRIGDMVGIEQAEEEHTIEDPGVIQDSSLKSSTEEIFPEEEKEFPSFDLQKTEQVETPRKIGDITGIEQAEEEHIVEDCNDHRGGIVQELSLGGVEDEEDGTTQPEIEQKLEGSEIAHVKDFYHHEEVPFIIELQEEEETELSTEGDEGSEGTADASTESNEEEQAWRAELPLDRVGDSKASLEESEVAESSTASWPNHENKIVNSEVVIDTRGNEVKANMDDASSPFEEGTCHCIKLNTENEERDCQNTEMGSETLGTPSISKNTEIVMELGANIDNGDDVVKELSTSVVASYKQSMEKSEITSIKENQELLEEFGEEESELLSEVGRSIVEEIFPEQEKELSSIDSEKIEAETPLRTDNIVGNGIAQAEETKVEDLGVTQDSSLESSAEGISPGQEEELPSVDFRKIEQLEAPTVTDDMVGIAQAEGQVVEDQEVIEENSPLESNAEEIFPEEKKELSSIDLEKIEQVETPMRNNDMVGIAEQKLEDSEVIQDSSFESSAEKTCPEKEKELPSIDLCKIEKVEVQKTTYDMVGIEQAEEEQKIEDSEVVQGSSTESSAEETCPEKEEVLPSIDLEKNEVGTPKRTDDMIGIEKAEEEHELEDSEVIQDSSWQSNAEEIFPEEEKEFPSVDFKKIEQVEPPKSTCDMVGIAQAEEVQKIEESEVIRDSESSAEEISSGQEDLKIKQVEPPKMTKDMVGIEQAEGEQEGEGQAEEIFPKKKQDLPLFDLQKIEQAETPKRIGDIAGIEQAEEEHIVEDPEVNQGSSLKSSTREIFSEEEKELPSIDLQKIEQVETLKRIGDNAGIEQAEEEHIVEDPEVNQYSSLKSSTEEIFPEEEIEFPSFDLQKTKQVETPRKIGDITGIEQAEEEHIVEDCNDHRGGIVQELSLGGVEEEEEDGTTQPEIEQKLEGSEIAHVKDFYHHEEVPFIIELQEEEETESSTEGDERSEGTADASTESNEEEQAWRAELPLDRVGDSKANLEESEVAESSTASWPNHNKIVNSEVVIDTRGNEVKANMDDASSPFEEGTCHCIKLNTENEERDCQNTEMGSETLGTPSISKNTEIVMELGANIDNGDDVVKELSTSVVASYKQSMEKSEITSIKENQELLEEFGEEESELLSEVGRSIVEEIFPEQEKELSSIDSEKIEAETPLRTDNIVGNGIAQAEETKVENLEVTQDTSLESSAEGISPGQEEELPSVDFRKIEQLEAPTVTDDMVGIAQAEGQVVEDLEVIEENSPLESNAEEIFPEEEKELSSIDLEKIEQVETPMRNNDMVGIAEQKLEDSEVIQDSSFESSAEKTCPEKEKELPSIDLCKIEQVETQKTTDDMIDIEQAEEEQKIEDSEVVQGSSRESSAEKSFPEKEEVLPSIDLEKNEVGTPKRTDDMIGIEKAEEEHELEDSEVIQDSSWESNAEEIFPEEEKEFPLVDLKKIEQVEPPKSTCDMVGIAQAEEVQKVEESEVIRDSESSAEEISSRQEEEKIEQVEPPKMTDDMVGIEQAEGEQEGEGPTEEIFPKKKQELPYLQKIEQAETPKRIGDMVGIEQPEEEHIVEDPEVIQESSLKSSTEEIFAEEEKELPSIDLQKIEQVETPRRIGDIAGIEQAEEEHIVEDPEVNQDSSLKSSTEENFLEEEIELPSIVFKKIEQAETPKTTDDMVGTEQAEEEDLEAVQDSSLESSAEEIFHGQGKEMPWIDSKKIEQVVPPKRTSDLVAISFRLFALLLLAMTLALGLVAFAQADSLYRRSNHHLPELYHKLSQLLFASYQRAVGDI